MTTKIKISDTKIDMSITDGAGTHTKTLGALSWGDVYKWAAAMFEVALNTGNCVQNLSVRATQKQSINCDMSASSDADKLSYEVDASGAEIVIKHAKQAHCGCGDGECLNNICGGKCVDPFVKKHIYNKFLVKRK